MRVAGPSFARGFTSPVYLQSPGVDLPVTREPPVLSQPSVVAQPEALAALAGMHRASPAIDQGP